MGSCHGHFCSKETPARFNNRWMAELSDRPISKLTIPGTHDSCCRKTWDFLENQSWHLEDQLRAGIRYIDIRCRHINDEFSIHHKWIFCRLFFSDVMEILKQFLRDYSTETVIMRVKEEYTPENNTRTFYETFMEYYLRYRDIIYIENIIPNLDQVRGKVVILVDFEFDKGIKFVDCDTQDLWQMHSIFDVNLKVRVVKEHLHKTIYGNFQRLYLNHLSGIGYGVFPSYVARRTNKIPMEYIGRLGIVICDYPGEGLIEHLISQNNSALQ